MGLSNAWIAPACACMWGAIAIAAPAPARADAPSGAPPRVMSLPDAIAHARSHQPAARAALARVAAERASAQVPRAAWLPSVGVTAQIFAATANNTTGTYVGAPLVDVPRIGGTKVVSLGTMQPYASTFVGAGVQQEIYDFGRLAAQGAAADARVEVARQRAAATRIEVELAVEEAFFAVHAARAVLRASEEAHERARVHRDLAAAAVGAGLRSPLELTRAEADLARFDVGRERARAGLLMAQSLLAAAVGVDDATLDVPPEPPSVRELPSALENSRDPRIAEAEARLRAQELATRAIGAELRPNLALTASISGRAGGAAPSGTGEPARGGGLLPDVPNWDVGVVFTWPIFHGPTAARERASRAREEVEREQLAEVRQALRVAVQRAWIAVSVARSALPALERGVAAARANDDQADARFKSGLGTSVEVADAEALRVDAEIALATGRFDLARARVALARALAEER